MRVRSSFQTVWAPGNRSPGARSVFGLRALSDARGAKSSSTSAYALNNRDDALAIRGAETENATTAYITPQGSVRSRTGTLGLVCRGSGQAR